MRIQAANGIIRQLRKACQAEISFTFCLLLRPLAVIGVVHDGISEPTVFLLVIIQFQDCWLYLANQDFAAHVVCHLEITGQDLLSTRDEAFRNFVGVNFPIMGRRETAHFFLSLIVKRKEKIL